MNTQTYQIPGLKIEPTHTQRMVFVLEDHCERLEEQVKEAEAFYQGFLAPTATHRERQTFLADIEALKFQHRRVKLQLEEAQRVSIGVDAVVRMRKR